MPNIARNKFVIVGGASLLGSHIAEQLLDGGASEVVLFDNLSLGSTEHLDSMLADQRCSFVRGDMIRLNELMDPFEGASGVFAVAGFLGAPMTANPWMGLDVNVRGVQNVYEAARVRGVKKVIFSSSVGVYGATGNDPASDETPLRWQTLSPGVILYCTSKIMGEALGRAYKEKYGLDFLALRYSSLYGERQHKRALDATRLVQAYEQVRAGERPVIEGDGSLGLDYIYVGDVARANLMAMESSASGEGFNISSGTNTSLSRMIELIIEECGANLEPEYRDAAAGANQVSAREGFARDRARELIGWEPQVSIEQGVARLVRWFDQSHADADKQAQAA